MWDWLSKRFESIVDNLIFAAIVAVGLAIWNIIKSLPVLWILVISAAGFIVIMVAIRIGVYYKHKSKKHSGREDSSAGKQEVQKSSNLSDTLTEMNRRLVELQKEKASHTHVSLKRLDKASWIFFEKFGLVPLKDRQKYLSEMKRRIRRGVPRPSFRQSWKNAFIKWAEYRNKIRERGISVALEMQRELVGTKDWTLEDVLNVGAWLDDFGWGIKEVRDNDQQWNDMWKSISEYLKDETLRKLINEHVDISYAYNNVCLMGHYSESLGKKASFLAELHSALVGSGISPQKAELGLSEILSKIDKYLSGESEKKDGINNNLSLAYSPTDKYVRVHRCSQCGYGFEVLLFNTKATCPKCGNIDGC